MNVEEMTFGVEIETTIPRGALRVGPHGGGYEIPADVLGMEGWQADSDPSIRARGDHVACEFVSPVLKGSAGLKQLLAAVAKMKALGAKVNDSCGCHVHVGANKADAEFMARLITLVANFEKAIYATTGTKKRESGRWCNRVSRYGNADNALQSARHSRYHVLNVATGTKPTVEFRAFGATLDAVKLTGYVSMCVALVERAGRAKKTTDWSAKAPKATSPIHRSGEGHTAVARLFYQLGWTKGRQPHVHGNLTGEGIPALKKVKKELVRLAKKYDNPAAATPRRDGLAVGARVVVNAVGSPANGLTGVVATLNGRRMPTVRIDNVPAFGSHANRLYRVAARHLALAPAAPAS